MSRNDARRKSYKITALSSEKKRKSPAENRRLTGTKILHSGYVATDSYKAAVQLLYTLQLKPLLIAKINSVIDFNYALIAYCKTTNSLLELWEIKFTGKQVEAAPYKPKDIYVDTLIQHTYLNLAQQLLKENSPPIIAPGVLFKPLIELQLHD